MKLIAALLLIAPTMLTAAHAGGDGDSDRRARVQRSIYEVATGQYRSAPQMYEGRNAATRDRLRAGSSADPEYFQQENDNRY